ncbi:melanocortin receptor 4-like [Stylophora pistillata]|uniref:melanocortin receptor 4-like n=1 Tax=Stylophora pistillata TaxID=50429 RepID=UPI000C04E73D|nr:melanocortin receptor 4-like [Stylophora pistillata]
MTGGEGNISQELIRLSISHESEKTGDVITGTILHIFVSILTALENLLVLITILGSSRLRVSPSNILLCGLVLSDLCTGLISEPCFIALQILVYQNKLTSCVFPIVHVIISSFLKGVSLFTVTAISIDRYFAIYFHLRYPEIVTEKRAQIALVCLWFLSGMASIAWSSGYVVFSQVTLIVTTVCLVAVFYTWTKVYQVMRRHQAQIHAHRNTGPRQMDMCRLKTSFINTMYILMIFLVCYLPYLLISFVFAYELHPTDATFSLYMFFYFFTLVNSLLNPLLYCWRDHSIRSAAKQTLKKLFCKSQSQ